MNTIFLPISCALALACLVACTESPKGRPSDGGPTDGPLATDLRVYDLVRPDLDPAAPICQPATCDGCCADDYRCLRGTAQATCGKQGEACSPCAAPNSCVGGVCTAGTIEICNGEDDDSDGDIDEGCDDDLDGYCDATMEVVGTPDVCPRGNDDCDDERPRVNPGATEICNALDDNCDTTPDESGCAPITDVVPSRPAHLPEVVRDQSCVAATDGKIYCFGGLTHLLDISDRVVVYDPATETVSVAAARLPLPRSELSCAASSAGPIYCFGGYVQRRVCTARNEQGCVDSIVEAYLYDEVFAHDPQSGAMTVKRAKLPAPTSRMACASADASGQILCFGGQQVDALSDQIVAYDPTLDQMITKSARLPSARKALSCASAGAEIFCFGGEDDSGRLASIVQYSLATDTAGELSVSLPAALSHLACAATADAQRVLCVGGRGKAGTPPLQYDDAVAQIVELTVAAPAVTTLSLHLAEPRDSHACTLHGGSGTIFCLGGSRNDLFFDEIVAVAP